MIKLNTRDPAIQKAVNAVYELSEDEVLQEQIWQKEKAINDYNNDMTVARKEGYKEGLEIAREEARKKGYIEGQMLMLKQLVENGLITVSYAAKTVDMTTDEFLSKTGLKL